MEFFKEASHDDFYKALSEYEAVIPFDIRVKIDYQNKVSMEAVKLYQLVTGSSLVSCRDTLTKYFSVVCAYRDFKDGKKIYTKY